MSKAYSDQASWPAGVSLRTIRILIWSGYTPDSIREARLEDLKAVRGISPRLAQKILASITAESET